MFCIYRITNTVNGKTYIGQHKYKDESNPMGYYKGSGKILRQAYRKYGYNKFRTEILYQRILTQTTANSLEVYAISKYKPDYNISKGGQGGCVVERTKEMNLKTSRTLKEKVRNGEHKGWKKGHIPWNSGKKCPQISEGLRGRICPDKARQALISYNESIKGIKRKWCNNGIINKLVVEIPEGFKPGKLVRSK